MTRKGELLSEIIKKELETIATYSGSIGEAATTSTLDLLSLSLRKLNDACREKMQDSTQDTLKHVIRILEEDKDLSPAHQELIRAWVVGDAASYAKMENDHHAWIAELNRLLKELASSRGRELGAQELLNVQAQVRDALRTTGDITYFTEQRERAKRFDEATAGWSTESKKFVARMLRAKLESEEI